MWLFTRCGFFSIVDGFDPGTMQIRARRKDHLERLQASFTLSGPILETPDADYRYRITVRRSTAHELLWHLSADIDYPNFKNAAEETWGKDDPYVIALHRIWSEMGQLQPGGPYGWNAHQDDDQEEAWHRFAEEGDECCTYRDHGKAICSCPDHPQGALHPFGYAPVAEALREANAARRCRFCQVSIYTGEQMWKCCPEHTPANSTLVSCEPCYIQRHGASTVTPEPHESGN